MTRKIALLPVYCLALGVGLAAVIAYEAADSLSTTLDDLERAAENWSYVR